MYFLRERGGDGFRLERLPTDRTMFCPDGPTTVFDYARNGLYERSIMDWAKDTLIPPGKVFVDIGAHVGTYSITMATKASRCIAFECTPKTYNYLCANIALHDLHDTVTAHNVAIGDFNGTTQLYIRDSKDGGANGCRKFESLETATQSRCVDVPIRTLDSFQLSNIGLLKIDVEGFELGVLRGAVETLSTNGHPKFLFESWHEQQPNVPGKELRAELFDYIDSIGYRVVPIRGWKDNFLAEYRA